MDIPSIFFGLFIGLFIPTSTKAVQQTMTIWRRTRTLRNTYLYMIWVETVVNLIFSIVTYLYLNAVIPGSFGFYFGTVLLWSIQTQLLSQIIANRISLIMTSKRKSRLLRWVLFVLIGLVNISVFCIWIPAHLEGASPRMVAFNEIWEHFEKSFFLVLDCGLNVYFVYLVRYRLIADGLSKYWRLFHFNCAIILVSSSMDVLLLGMLSLPNPYDYVQWAPVAYIVKLQIELTMAVLISKVVRSSSSKPVDRQSSANHTANRTNAHRSINAWPDRGPPDNAYPHSGRVDTNISGGMMGGLQDEDKCAGIMKTVTTMVKSDSDVESCEGYQVSTKRLTGDFTLHNSSSGDVSDSP